MKKAILLLVLLFIVRLTCYTQAPPPPQPITISGQVMSESGKEIPNLAIYIRSDTISNYYYYDYYYQQVVKTNANGKYADTVHIPYGIVNVTFHLSLLDCNGQSVAKTFTMDDNTLNYIVNFAICDNSSPTPPTCQSYFSFYKNDSINNNLTYQFINQSKGAAIKSWHWTFGDNTSSNEINPIHVYSKFGNYNVCLYIKSWDKDSTLILCTDYYCSTVNVADVPPYDGCKAEFYAVIDTSADNNGKYVYKFKDQSNADSIVSWYWAFGDSTYSTLQNPEHIYAKPGSYNVCLTITSIPPVSSYPACTNTYCLALKIPNNPPPQSCSAGFYYITYNPGNDTINKDSVVPPIIIENAFRFISTSSGGNVPITKWKWNFGDGTGSTLQDPIHVFQPGNYNVCLTIYTGTDTINNCYNTYCQNVAVGMVNQCQANFYYVPDSLSNSLQYSFFNTSSGRPDKFLWNFGDSTTSVLMDPVHIYQRPGTYNVCLTISNDSMNCTGTYCMSISTLPDSGNCHIYYSYFEDSKIVTKNGYYAYQFELENSSNLQNVLWNFGDGTVTDTINPIHIFKSGEYNVCVTATIYERDTINSCNAYTCQEISVGTVVPPPLQNCFNYFTYSIYSGNSTGYTVNFSAIANPDNNVIYFWNFGDGSVDSTTIGTVNHTYNRMRNFNVCLTTFTMDSVSCSYTSCQNVPGDRADSTTHFGSINGQIYAGSNLADYGLVSVANLYNGNISYLDTEPIGINGTYSFYKVPYGSYYVYAKLDTSSAYFNQFIPTFYGDSWQWETANLVVVDSAENSNIDIHLIAKKPFSKFTCHISGYVTNSSFKNATGAPVSNTEVVLLDDNSTPLDVTYSNNKGYYIFQDLNYGTYMLYVEVIGLQPVPAIVTLNPDTTGVDNINFVINGTNVDPQNIATSIHNFSATNSFSEIFPDPVKDIANIKVELSLRQNVKLEVYNSLGQLQSSVIYNLNAGNYILNVSTASLSKGIYFVKIADENSIVNRKFIKLN